MSVNHKTWSLSYPVKEESISLGSLPLRVSFFVLILTAIRLYGLPYPGIGGLLISLMGILFISRNLSDRLIIWVAISPIAIHFNYQLPSGIPDIKFDQVVILVILLLSVGSRDSSQKIKLTFGNPLELTMILFFAASLLSILFSFNYRTSLRTLFDSYFVPFIIYMLAKNLLVEKKHILDLVRVCAILGILFSILGIYEHFTLTDLLPSGETGRAAGLRVFGSFVRVNGPFGDPEVLGMVLSVIFFLNIFLLKAVEVKGMLNVVIKAGLFLIPVALYFTMFRGIWLAFLIPIVFRRFKKSHLPTGVIMLLLVLILPIFFVLMSISKDWMASSDLYTTRISNEDTFYSRVATWKLALRFFLDNPILGIGLSNFSEVCERESAVAFFRGVVSVTSPHNSFLSVLAERGIIGFLLFCMIFYNMFKMFFSYYQKSRTVFDAELALAGISSIIALTIASMTLTFVNEPGFINKFFFLIFGVLAGRYFNNPSQKGNMECRETETP